MRRFDDWLLGRDALGMDSVRRVIEGYQTTLRDSLGLREIERVQEQLRVTLEPFTASQQWMEQFQKSVSSSLGLGTPIMMERSLSGVLGLDDAALDIVRNAVWYPPASGQLATLVSEFPPEALASFDEVSRDAVVASVNEAVVAVGDVPTSDRFVEVLQWLARKGAWASFFFVLWLLSTLVEGFVQDVGSALLRPVKDRVVRRFEESWGTVPALVVAEPLRVGVVTAHGLRVRAHPRRNDSRILATVDFPQVVVIVRERKDWTLVEYEGGDGVLHGWVFSRYVRRLPTQSPAIEVSAD